MAAAARVLALGFVVAASGCGGGYRFALPAGAGAPAPDAAAAWAQATNSCRDVHTVSATLTIKSLHVGSEGFPTLTVITGATDDGGIYLEGEYRGNPVFKLGGTTDRATLVLVDNNNNRTDTVTARTDEILENFVGLKIGPARWMALLTGCVTTNATMTGAKAFGNMIAVTTSDGVVQLDHLTGVWRTSGGVFDQLTIGYRGRAADWPGQWTLASVPGAGQDVRLDVLSDDPHVNDVSITAASFIAAAKPPADAVAITLEDLRAAGPLRRKK